jgi:hypothetical protein
MHHFNDQKVTGLRDAAAAKSNASTTLSFDCGDGQLV